MIFVMLAIARFSSAARAQSSSPSPVTRMPAAQSTSGADAS